MLKAIMLILALCLLPLPSEAALRVAVGSYTVDDDPSNDDDRVITVTPSFPISAVMIKCAGATHPVWRTADGGGSNTQFVSTAAAQVSNAIQALGTGSITLGTRTEVQPDCGTSCTTTCYYWAIGGDSTEIAEGSYTGNGVDDRDVVTGLAFQPGLVLVKSRTTAGSTWFKIPANSAGNSINFGTASNTADQIQALNADGYQVGAGTGVNTDTVGYVWLAVKDVAGQVASGSFAGDGLDDKAITMFDSPILAWIKRNGATTACGRWGSVGDVSWLMGASAEMADGLQAFTGTGATVGTNACVNNSGSTMYWWAARDVVTASRNRLRRTTIQ